jgi:hypothetical protein
MATPKDQFSELPPDVDDLPAVRAMKDRHDLALRRLAETNARIFEIDQELSPNSGWLDDKKADAGKRALDEAADAILAGTPLDKLGSASRKEELRAEAKRLYSLLRPLERAIKRAERELSEARFRGSQEVLPIVEPEYRRIVKGMADAIVQLRRFSLEEQRLRDRFHMYGSWALFPSLIRPMCLAGSYISTDKVSPDKFQNWIVEAIEYKLLDESYAAKVDMPVPVPEKPSRILPVRDPEPIRQKQELEEVGL